jgi:hypothetical protein
MTNDLISNMMENLAGRRFLSLLGTAEARGGTGPTTRQEPIIQHSQISFLGKHVAKLFRNIRGVIL